MTLIPLPAAAPITTRDDLDIKIPSLYEGILSQKDRDLAKKLKQPMFLAQKVAMGSPLL